MNNKGQGAIEYLLIIGAAILVVAIVVVTMTGIVGTGGENVGDEQVAATYNPLLEAKANAENKYFIPIGTSEYYTYTGSGTTLGNLATLGENIIVCIEDYCNNNYPDTSINSLNIVKITASGGHGTLQKNNLEEIDPLENKMSQAEIDLRITRGEIPITESTTTFIKGATYFLTQNESRNFNLTLSNYGTATTTIDCAGRKIHSFNGVAVNINSSYITIKNCVITENTLGIDIQYNINNINLENVQISSNEQGNRMSYTSSANYNNVRICNNLSYNLYCSAPAVLTGSITTSTPQSPCNISALTITPCP